MQLLSNPVARAAARRLFRMAARVGLRTTLPSLALGLCLSVSLPGQAADRAEASTPVLAVDGGRIAGRALPGGLHAYLGVPYAAPPVRELRWQPPQPVPAWAGVFNADRFGPQCVQPQRHAMANQYGGVEITSEDCLTLNVWATAGAKNLPVLVYLHGGAFFIGSGSAPLYQGEAVARQGAVFVSLNYRLGVLGLLAHAELSRESPDKASGNYGLLDQIAALRWVQRNAAAFGGDPARVTIVGQSAGSMSVMALQASPLAKGLFSRAVGMSGAVLQDASPFGLRSLAEAEADGQRFLALMNASSIEALRQLPADRLVAPRTPGAPRFGLIVDGHVLPEGIAATFARGAQHDVPLLLSFTRDETLGGLGAVRTLAEYQAKAQERFGERAAEFLRLYPASTDAEARAQARLADRDASVTRPMKAWADAQARPGHAAVYTTMFARPHRYAPGVRFSDLDPASAGAYHTSEVPFWLGTLEAFNRFRPTRAWSPEDRQLSDSMVELLVRFAATGVAQTERVQLPRYDPAQPQLLEMGEALRAQAWPAQQQLDYFAAAAAPTAAAAPAARD